MSELAAITEASMLNSMHRLNVISHNLANVNTVGFKREIVVTPSFASQLAGMSGDQVYTNISQGSLRHTGNRMDLALEGEGFFEVVQDGRTYFTRHGAFAVNAQGQLATEQGAVLAGVGGDIRVEGQDVRIDIEGFVWEDEKRVGQVRVVQFDDLRAMTKVGGNMFSAPQHASPVELVPGNVSIRQGFQETSNVVSMDEMVNMISTMRHFEMSQKLLLSYDEVLEQAIQTLGEV